MSLGIVEIRTDRDPCFVSHGLARIMLAPPRRPLITSRQLPPFSPAQSHTRRRRRTRGREGGREGGRNLYSCSKRRPPARPSSIHRVRDRHRMTSHCRKPPQVYNAFNPFRPLPSKFQPFSRHLFSPTSCPRHPVVSCMAARKRERGRNSFGDRPKIDWEFVPT